ncbi:MAG: preprotein translocase subunit SecG [bacterium]
MYGLLISFYTIVCCGLIIVILLQSSKGGGLAGAFGGGGGDMGAVFGGRGAATFLSRVTTGLATAFLVLSVLISMLSRGTTDGGGLVQQEQKKRASSLPASVPIVPADDALDVLPVETTEPLTPAPADSGQ